MRTETELREALEGLADRAPAGDALVDGLPPTGVRDRRRRRQTALVLIAATAAVMAVLAFGAPLVTAPRTAQPAATPTSAIPTDRRVPGNWSMISTVTPPTGWRVVQREVYVDGEQSVLRPTGATNGDASCYATINSKYDWPPVGTTQTLAGKSGFFDASQGAFSYRFGGDEIVVSCGGIKEVGPQIAKIIPGIRFDRQDIRVPFTLTAIPAGLEVKTIYEGDDPVIGDQGADLGSSSVVGGPGSITIRVARDPIAGAREFGLELEPVTISGEQAMYNDTVGLCFPGKVALCVGDTTGELGPPEAGSPISAKLRELAEAIEPAGDLGDRSTWPTGLQAIPG